MRNIGIGFLGLLFLFPNNSAVAETALQNEARQLGRTYQKEGITRFRNSDLGKRLPERYTLAQDAFNWVPNGESSRGCFAPESTGSLQALVQQMVQDRVPYKIVKKGEFNCVVRVCRDDEIDEFISTNPTIAKAGGMNAGYFGDPTKHSGKKGGCTMTADQRDRIHMNAKVVDTNTPP